MRFLRELVKKRWSATVISCQPYQYERYDPQLLTEVPSCTRIVRVKGPDPWRAFQTWRGVRIENKLATSSAEEVRQVIAGQYAPWRSRLRDLVGLAEACIYRPDMFMLWIKPAAREAITICQRNRPNVIWATIGPLSAGVVAYRTSVATEVPYVLDFRDPWGLEYYAEEVRRPTWARQIDNRIISRMFEHAQAVVFMFESIAERYMEAFPAALSTNKIHIIPNGFEGEVESFSHMPSGSCTVLYAGTLHTYRYDSLLQGLVQLKRIAPKYAAQLRLRFIGEGLRELSERVADLDLRDVIEILPPTSSVEVRRLQQEAHALLILGRTSGRKGHNLVAGAKLFGYLQAGRPIIGVVPRDETRRILVQIGSQLIADADAPEEVATVFGELVKAWSNKTLERFVPSRIACEAYSSGHQVSDLIAALDGKSPNKAATAGKPTFPPRVQSEVIP
ncbi:MAG TPA: glycosyltransferase [Nitrospira sp.]|nr:glycosyltransferase [Nitrospira sp.]